MNKRLLAVVTCLLVLLASTFAFAADVYITKSGSKYHAQDCPLIANKQTQAISQEEAETKGLTACLKCLAKNQLSSEEKDDAVYVTKSGTKYHKPECNLIKNRQTSQIPIEEAVQKGLEPCGKCFPKQAKAE